MNNNWVKLWENTLENDVWLYDPTAWRIFEYLLICAYRGKPQGTTVKTTQQITNACFGASGKNGTVFKALKRLTVRNMVITESTNRMTTFKIVNWWKYQGTKSSGNNEVQTKYKPSKTLIKNKEERIKNNTYSEVEVLKIINPILKREFRVLPRGWVKMTEKFTLEEIQKSLTNLSKDAWHRDKLPTLKLDYLLRDTTIDKFLVEEAVQDDGFVRTRLNLTTGKMEEY
jgi:hypothetical protein